MIKRARKNHYHFIIIIITILIKFTRRKENREHQEGVLCYNFR